MLDKLKLLSRFMRLCLFLYAYMDVEGGFPTTFKLERAFDIPTQLSHLRDRDVQRSTKLLRSRPLDFPLEGSSDLNIAGFYYTKIELGSPPKEFNVMIDTGSDALWVSCNPCNGCPISSKPQIPLELYDPSKSSTASPISCDDQRCSIAAQSSIVGCSGADNRCIYTIPYADDSKTSGYYVHDLMHLNAHGAASNYSADVAFGCSTSRNGSLASGDSRVDGIFGFGPQQISVIAQLFSQGITPSVFSHCLTGNQTGGGLLVVGQILEPNMAYTPLVPSRPYYNVDMQSISVNGQRLSIDPSIFEISKNYGGTIIDSGTTLAFLPEEAFHPFVDAITQSVSKSVRPFMSNDSWCYSISSSVSEIFPIVSLNFAGGAIMHLGPKDYLIQQPFVDGMNIWCIGFLKSPFRRMTILGELVLKDKLIVYDLGCQRIGWKNYDCSMPVNVSSNSNCNRHRSVHSSSSSLVTRCEQLLLVLIILVSCYQNLKGM